MLRECRAQIERAIAWGIDVTHLAPHLTAITLRPEFFDVYLELAVEFRLPIRLPSTITAEQAGFPFRQLAAEEGVRLPRPLRPRLARRQPRPGVRRRSRDLQPGVTEIHVQPAIDTPEVRALTDGARRGSTTTSWSPTSHACATLLAAVGATLIGYRGAQGRDASRLTHGCVGVGRPGERARTAAPVGPGALQLAPHERDRRIERRRRRAGDA